MLGNKCLSKMSTYWSGSILPLTSATSPTPFQPIQPHTMMFPPPNFTVSSTFLSISPSPAFFHTHCFPSDPILFILVLSDHMTFFQFSTVHSLCFRAKANLFFLCTAVSNGFFFFVTALNECCFSTILTVCRQTGWEIMVLMCLVTWTALAAFPVVIWVWTDHVSVGESLEGQPPEETCQPGWRSWRTLEIVDLLTPSLEAIWWVDNPLEARERCFPSEQRRWHAGWIGGLCECWPLLNTLKLETS